MLKNLFLNEKRPKHTMFHIALLQRKVTLEASKIRRKINNKNNATAFFSTFQLFWPPL